MITMPICGFQSCHLARQACSSHHQIVTWISFSNLSNWPLLKEDQKLLYFLICIILFIHHKFQVVASPNGVTGARVIAPGQSLLLTTASGNAPITLAESQAPARKKLKTQKHFITSYLERITLLTNLQCTINVLVRNHFELYNYITLSSYKGFLGWKEI